LSRPPDPSPPKTPPCNSSLEPFLPPPTRSNSNSPQIPLSTFSLSPLLLIQEVSFLLLHPQLTEFPCILLCFLTSYYHRGARQIQRQNLFISFFLEGGVVLGPTPLFFSTSPKDSPPFSLHLHRAVQLRLSEDEVIVGGEVVAAEALQCRPPAYRPACGWTWTW
jgi:hypothetical protein